MAPPEGSEWIFLLCSPCLFTALCVWDQDRQGSSTAALGQSPLALAVVLLRVPRTMATVIQNTPPGAKAKQLEGGVRGGLVISRSPEPSFHLQACASPTLLSKEKEGRVRTKCGGILSLGGKKQDSFIFTSKRETTPLSGQPSVCRPSTRTASCCYLPFSLAGKDR